MIYKILSFVCRISVFTFSFAGWASDDALDMVQRNALISSVSQIVTPTLLEDKLPKQARPITFGVLDALPRDVIGGRILKYCCDHKILQVNTSFFTLGTGYTSDHILDQGFDSRPTQYFYPTSSYVKLRSCRKNLDQIPSFVWYSMIQAVSDLNFDYWPYLKQSRIEELNFSNLSLSPNKERLCQAIENSQVYRLNLSFCSIEKIAIPGLIQALIKTNVNILDLSYLDVWYGDLKSTQGWIEHLPQTKIHTLYLAGNQINDDNIRILAPTLLKSHIHTVHLSGNHITDISASALVNVIQKQSLQLQAFWIGNNDISAECALNLCQSFQGTNLHTLDLSHTLIRKEHVKMLGQYLRRTRVKKFVFNENTLGAGICDLIQALQGSCVSLLSLNKNMIKDDDLVGLDQYLKHTQIHTLILAGNDITNTGFDYLLKALSGSAVRKLYLGGNKISVEGIDDLIPGFEGTFVYKLDLLDTKIDITGFCQLIDDLKNTPIKKLGLGKTFHSKSNATHERQWQDFARAVQRSSLTKLDLSQNGFKMTDVCHIVQACQNSSVHYLDLSDNDIEDNQIQDLIESLQNSPLKKINLSDNHKLGEFSKIKLIQSYPEIDFYFNKHEGTETMREKPFKN